MDCLMGYIVLNVEGDGKAAVFSRGGAAFTERVYWMDLSPKTQENLCFGFNTLTCATSR